MNFDKMVVLKGQHLPLVAAICLHSIGFSQHAEIQPIFSANTT